MPVSVRCSITCWSTSRSTNRSRPGLQAREPRYARNPGGAGAIQPPDVARSDPAQGEHRNPAGLNQAGEAQRAQRRHPGMAWRRKHRRQQRGIDAGAFSTLQRRGRMHGGGDQPGRAPAPNAACGADVMFRQVHAVGPDRCRQPDVIRHQQQNTFGSALGRKSAGQRRSVRGFVVAQDNCGARGQGCRCRKRVGQPDRVRHQNQARQLPPPSAAC